MEKQYFICHSQEDASLAESLKEELESNGYKCWISTKLVNQPNLEKITNKTLVESDAVILVFTENTSTSSNVRIELDIASNQRIPILTLEFQKSEPSESIAYYTHGQKWIDCKFKQEYTPEILHAIFDISKIDINEITTDKTKERKVSWWQIAIVLALLLVVIFTVSNKKSVSNPSISLLNIAVGNLASWDYASDVCKTSNGNYVIAGGWDWGYWNKIWVARLNENGELLNIWTDSITGESQPQLLPCADNSCILVYADLSEITNSSIIFTSIKLNSSGNVIWQTQHEVPIENATGIRLTCLKWIQVNSLSASFSVELPRGNQHLVINAVIDSNSGECTHFILPNRADLHKMTVTPNGNLLHLTHLSALAEDMVTITTPDGENVSINSFSDNYNPVSIGFTSDSSLIVARSTGGVNGVLSIIQLSESYEIQWENFFENDLTGTFTELAILNNDNILIAGYTSPDENDETDGRLICLDNNGKLLWQKIIDNGADEQILSLYVSADASILLTGTTTRFGNRDAWFLSLSSTGEYDEYCVLGFDILLDDFELGFINRDSWDIQLNQNSPAVTAGNNQGNGSVLNIQSGLIVQKNAILNTTGLVFSAELFLPEEFQTSDSNWITFGTSEINLISMIQPDSKAADGIFQVNLTPTENILIETSRTEPNASLIFPGLSLMNNKQTHVIEIESQADSIYFSADGNLLFKTATATHPDSLYFFLEGNAHTVSYNIDNIRIYQKSW